MISRSLSLTPSTSVPPCALANAANSSPSESRVGPLISLPENTTSFSPSVESSPRLILSSKESALSGILLTPYQSLVTSR